LIVFALYLSKSTDAHPEISDFIGDPTTQNARNRPKPPKITSKLIIFDKKVLFPATNPCPQARLLIVFAVTRALFSKIHRCPS
jgi:hypothetical protein